VFLLYSAKSLASGNINLRGWAFPACNFFFLDQIPFFIGYLLAGLRPIVPEVIGPLNFSILTVAAITCASVNLDKQYFRAALALLLVSAIAPSNPAFTFAVFSPWHVLTISIALGLFILDARYYEKNWLRRQVWTVPMIALTTFSDPLFITIYIIPTIIARALTLIRGKNTDGKIGLDLFKRNLEIVLGIAGAIFVHGVFVLTDGLKTVGVNVAFDNLHNIKNNLINVAVNWATLFYKRPIDFRYLHLIALAGLALAVLAAVIVSATIVRAICCVKGNAFLQNSADRDYLLLVLSFASITQIAACAASAQYTWALAHTNPLSSLLAVRYVFPAYVFGALALIRALPSGKAFSLWAITVLCVLLVTVSDALHFNIKRRNSHGARVSAEYGKKKIVRLVRILKHDKLTCGYGPYWDSYTIGLGTKPNIFILPVSEVGPKIVPRVWQSEAEWYSSRPPCVANFVIRKAHQRLSFGGLKKVAIVRTFGKPDKQVSVGDYRVYMYNHAINFISRYKQ
jgi:hypothetical protein